MIMLIGIDTLSDSLLMSWMKVISLVASVSFSNSRALCFSPELAWCHHVDHLAADIPYGSACCSVYEGKILLARVISHPESILRFACEFGWVCALFFRRHVRLQQMGMGSALAFAAVAYLTARNNDSHSWDSHSVMSALLG